MSAYLAFLDEKTHANERAGFAPTVLPDFLFDFQTALVEWAVQKGRAALFADCGLGKTAMQLVWADNVVRHTGGRVLVIAPLAVSQQVVTEGEKFGVAVTRSTDGTAHAGITVTNYERLHHFDPRDFAGAVCDESSILKAFDGTRRLQITQFLRKLEYRLLATATAAPNDFTELGTSSEALGYLGHMDMLGRFFRNDQNNAALRAGGRAMAWRFKGHAERPFWRWVCSWARAVRRPSDLGFADDRFVLPPLEEVEHVVTSAWQREGELFALPAADLHEQREERRRTIGERCARVAALVDHGEPATVWCHLNDEGDLLERLIPDAVQVSGADSDDEKEAKLLAFQRGDARVLVTKPTIAGWGLNFQHCAHVTTFPSHSFESYYQSVRRSWRFGQARPVRVDLVTTEGERGVLQNLRAKQTQADRMFRSLVAEMSAAIATDRAPIGALAPEVPAWL